MVFNFFHIGSMFCISLYMILKQIKRSLNICMGDFNNIIRFLAILIQIGGTRLLQAFSILYILFILATLSVHYYT